MCVSGPSNIVIIKRDLSSILLTDMSIQLAGHALAGHAL